MHTLQHRITLARPGLLLSVFIGALLVLMVRPATAQDRADDLPRVSPSASVSQTIGVTEVTITYGRPSVRERAIFGELVPYGEVWRAGADEATTISFEHDVEVEGEPLEAGTYALFTIPREREWTIIFHEDPDQWGAYEYDPAGDVLRVNVTPESAPAQEQLAYRFEDVDRTSATVVMHWDEVAVPFEVAVDTDEIVAERARRAVEEGADWRTLHQFAAYALEYETHQREALEWIDASIAEEETFANLALKARILAWHGDYQMAQDLAERALATGANTEASEQAMDELRREAQEWH